MLPLHQRKRGEMDRDEVPPFLGVLGVADGTLSRWIRINAMRSGSWPNGLRLALEDRRLQQRVFRSLRGSRAQG